MNEFETTPPAARDHRLSPSGMLGTPASPAALHLTPGVAPDAMSWDTRAGRDVREAQAYVLCSVAGPRTITTTREPPESWGLRVRRILPIQMKHLRPLATGYTP
jgi:hypothetical protein